MVAIAECHVARDRAVFDRYLGNLISVRLLLLVLSGLVLAGAFRMLAPRADYVDFARGQWAKFCPEAVTSAPNGPR